MSALSNNMSALKWQQRQRTRQGHRMVNRRQRKVNQVSSTLDFVQIEPSSLEVGSGEFLHAALASLWRRKLLGGAIVATALALGIIAVRVLPAWYTAEAYIRGVFLASDPPPNSQDSGNAPISVDLVRVIETQSRLLQSKDLARQVVQQLGLEQLRPEMSENYWLPANSKEDQTDRAAKRLLGRLSVTSDPRAYLIEVQYTSRDSALAGVIANAFVAESLRSSKLQTLSLQRSSAEATLSRELAKFGDKHPTVILAKMQLAALDDLFKEKLSEAPEKSLQAAGENVTKAISARSSPKLVIGLFLLVGLVVGIAVPLWLERTRWAETFYRYYAPFA